MTKYLRDGVYRYGDDPFNVLDKYIDQHPVNKVRITQHKVEFWFDGAYLAGIFNPEDYPNQVDGMSVAYYKKDDRIFLTRSSITPDLIGKTIKTELGSAITVYAYEVGADYVTFKHRDNRNDPYITTAPFEGLSSWWIVE